MAQQVRHQAVKLNCAKQASRLMPFINGNIGANWRVELRGGPWGCWRETARQRRREQREGRGKAEEEEEEEGGSARGAHCQTFTTPSLLKRCEARAGPKPVFRKKKRNTHSVIYAHLHIRGCLVVLQRSGYHEVKIILPCHDFFLPPAQREAGVSGVELCWRGGGREHHPPQENG